MKMIAEFDQDGDFGQLDAGARCAAMPGHWRDALRLLTEAVSSKLRPSSPLRNSVLNVQSSDAPLEHAVTCCERLKLMEILTDGERCLYNCNMICNVWDTHFLISHVHRRKARAIAGELPSMQCRRGCRCLSENTG
jgi:hypothetical protein